MAVGQDKIEHWAFGFVLTLLYFVHPQLLWSALVFGAGKEIYDHFYGSGWSNRDLMATIGGFWTGMGFLVLVA